MKRRVAFLVVLPILLLYAACSHGSGPGPNGPTAAAAEVPPILRLVPADTPYLFATVEPLPAEYVEHELGRMRPMLEKAVHHLGRLGLSPDGEKIAQGVSDAILAHLSVEGLRQIGLGDTRAAFYGIGLFPVLRFTLTSPQAFETFVDGIEHAAGLSLPRVRRGGHEFRSLDLGKATVAFAILEDRKEAVLVVAPNEALDRTLGIAFGDTPPPAAASVRELMDRYGYRYAAGFLDFGRVTQALAELGVFGDAPECKSELGMFWAIAPRFTAGTTELSTTRWGASMTLELAPEIAKALQSMQVKVPGVGAPLGGAIASIGWAGDLDKLLDYLRPRLLLAKALSFRCSAFHGIPRMLDDIAQKLSQPLPGWTKGMRGFDLVLDKAEIGIAPDVKGYGFMSVNDPIHLIDLAKRLIPGMDALQVPADGRPVALPKGSIAMGLPSAWVAMKGSTIGVAIGNGADSEMAAKIAEMPGQTSPLFAFAFDHERLRALIKNVTALFGGSDLGFEMDGQFEMTVFADDHGLTMHAVRIVK